MAKYAMLLEGPPAVAEVSCWQPGRGGAGGEGGVFHSYVESWGCWEGSGGEEGGQLIKY